MPKGMEGVPAPVAEEEMPEGVSVEDEDVDEGGSEDVNINDEVFSGTQEHLGEMLKDGDEEITKEIGNNPGLIKKLGRMGMISMIALGVLMNTAQGGERVDTSGPIDGAGKINLTNPVDGSFGGKINLDKIPGAGGGDHDNIVTDSGFDDTTLHANVTNELADHSSPEEYNNNYDKVAQSLQAYGIDINEVLYGQ